MRAYMLEIVAPEKHSSTAKMEAIPGFYFLYSRIFLRVVRKGDLWESTQSHGKDHFEVTMKKCPLAHGLRGKRLRGAVPPVLRGG